jgi:hypothetical protein
MDGCESGCPLTPALSPEGGEGGIPLTPALSPEGGEGGGSFTLGSAGAAISEAAGKLAQSGMQGDGTFSLPG